jgi:L-rhamnose mutarotase
MDNEYDFIKDHIPYFPQKLTFSYGSIEELVDINANISRNKSRNSILIGNSSSIESNHLDILFLLKRINYTGSIYVPLSYGDDQYRTYICHVGQVLFGTNFMPILEYQSLSEYNRLFQECNSTILAHIRQQGIANAISALWYGSKLFMNPASPLYAYLKSSGITIYSIFDENLNMSILDSIECEQTVIKNRERLKDIYSKKTLDNIIKNNILQACAL